MQVSQPSGTLRKNQMYMKPYPLIILLTTVLLLAACSKTRKAVQVQKSVVSLEGPVAEEAPAPDPEEEAWKKAIATDDSDAYARFLQAYPNGKHAEKAWERVEEIWEEHQRKKSPAETAFPETSKRPREKAEVKTILPEDVQSGNTQRGEGKVSTSADDTNPGQSSAQDPSSAKTTGTAPENRENPTGPTPEMTKTELPNPGQKAPTGSFTNSGTHANRSAPAHQTAEENEWQHALASTSPATIKNFMAQYPQSKYRKAAGKKLVDLEVDQLVAGNHDKLPPLEKVESNSSGNNTVTIWNYTAYPMTVWFSGPHSEKGVLAAEEKMRFNLPNGHYRVVASVNRGSVSNYASTEELTGGEYESEFYIISVND